MQKKYKLFAECQMLGTRRNRLCRVPTDGTRRSVAFAECLDCSTRQRITAVSHPDGRRACWARARPLPCAGPTALGKDKICRVSSLCRLPTLGKHWACRVPCVCRVLRRRHSANVVFAECPCSGTRRTTWHSAKMRLRRPVRLVVRPVRTAKFKL